MSGRGHSVQELVEGILSRKAAARFRDRPSTADGPCCPKCAFTGADAPPLLVLDDWRQTVHIPADIAAVNHACDEQGKPLGEFLLVKCPRCGFGWAEPVRGEVEAAPS